MKSKKMWMIGMVASLSLGFALHAATAQKSQPQTLSIPGKGEVAAKVGADGFGIPTAVICYTCGGDWPVFSGALSISGGVTELGSGCSGDFQFTDDTYPYLCVKGDW